MVYIACTLSINIWPLFVEQARISQLAIFGAFVSTHCDVLVSACVAEFHKRKIAVTPYSTTSKHENRGFWFPWQRFAAACYCAIVPKKGVYRTLVFMQGIAYVTSSSHLCLMIVTDSLGVIIWQNGSRVKYSGWGSVFSTQSWASDSSVFLVQLLALLVLSRECVRLSYYVNILTSNYITST